MQTGKFKPENWTKEKGIYELSSRSLITILIIILSSVILPL